MLFYSHLKSNDCLCIKILKAIDQFWRNTNGSLNHKVFKINRRHMDIQNAKIGDISHVDEVFKNCVFFQSIL